jgi:hypothetical protein
MSETVFTLNLRDDKDVSALSDELRALGADLLDIRRGSDSPQTRIVGVEARVMMRALDHLRNADKSSKDLIRERDHLLAMLQIPPLTYRLRSWEFPAKNQDKAFWSYTGTYGKDDRLVTFGGHEFKVFSVEREATTTDDGLLIVVHS